MSSSAHIEVTELEADNIGGQRSKFDVMATILHICSDRSLKNHIVGKGKFFIKKPVTLEDLVDRINRISGDVEGEKDSSSSSSTSHNFFPSASFPTSV